MSRPLPPRDAAADSESWQALRVLAALEGISFVVLLVCSVLKRTTSYDLVPVAGTVHGVLYVIVVLLVLENLGSLRWAPWFTAVMLTVGSPGLHFPLRAQERREKRQLAGHEDYPPR